MTASMAVRSQANGDLAECRLPHSSCTVPHRDPNTSQCNAPQIDGLSH